MLIQQFNILARLDTTDYWTFFFRGIAKYNLGDLRGARADFDRSVRLNLPTATTTGPLPAAVSASTTRPLRILKRPFRCVPVRLASITAGV